MGNLEKIGASEGIRTLDVHLGKVMLYQTELRSRSEELRECRYGSSRLQAVFKTDLFAREKAASLAMGRGVLLKFRRCRRHPSRAKALRITWSASRS